jgi:hypothetical protein
LPQAASERAAMKAANTRVLFMVYLKVVKQFAENTSLTAG